MNVTGPCASYAPTITLDASIFPDQFYTLEDTAVNIPVDTAVDVTSDIDLSSCGAYTV
jgi:hypothetical protein